MKPGLLILKKPTPKITSKKLLNGDLDVVAAEGFNTIPAKIGAA